MWYEIEKNMMMKLVTLFILPISLFYADAKGELNCSNVYKIQKSYVAKHINHPSLSSVLESRTIDQIIKNLDPDKLYFIQSDVKQIKKWFTGSFNSFKKKDCQPLERLYNLFKQRVRERTAFAHNEISKKDFHLNKETALMLDSDKRKFMTAKNPIDQFHRKYIQYELASIMLIEEDIEKAKKHLIDTYDRKEKTILSWNPKPSKERLRHCLRQDKKNKLVKTCKYEKWYAFYLDSFARALDPHSSYLSRYELDDFEIQMKLSLEGVGASLSSQYGYTIIERLLPGGAASLSKKIKKKDKIVAIGQKADKMINIFGWNLRDVVEMIRGKKGTKVYLQILRSEPKGKKTKFTVSLIRNKIHLKDNASFIAYSTKKINGMDRTVGVIRIPSFYGGDGSRSERRSVTADVKKLLKEAKNKNVSAIVLDLSSNGGGILVEAVDLAGLFIQSGNVVRQKTKMHGRKTMYYTFKDEDDHIEYSGPLVVLVDRGSASASEIVAGALQDYKRAVVVGGDHTFGKGTIQSVEHIGNHLGATKTTVGIYYVPSGKSTQKMGIPADITLPSLISIDNFGEKTLDYVLPNQHTASFLTRSGNHHWNKISSRLIKRLQIYSTLRVKKNKKFKKIKKKIAEFKEKLNNPKPKKIKTFLTDAQKRNEEEQEQTEDIDFDFSDPKFKERYLERADVEEAINIAVDLFKLDPSFRSSIVKKS